MAGKLSIRRVGNFLPSLCLAGVLLVIAIITWLCTVGLPDCALRYIEQEAAKAGVQLTIDKIRLSPSSGLALKAEDVEVLLPQEDAAPVRLTIRKTQVAYSIARLLTGQFSPYSIRVVDGNLSLPLSAQAEDKLELEEIDVYSVFLPNSKSVSTTIKGQLHHAELEAKFLLVNPEQALAELGTAHSDKEGTSKTPADMLAEIRPALQDVKKQLDLQPWDAKVFPIIKLNIILGKKWKAELDASIPSIEWKHFHFREARLSSSVENETISIDHLSFRTVEPDTKVTLQGGYDWKARDLEFKVKSTAPLLRILNSHLEDEDKSILNKIQAPKDSTPIIELNGSANLSENYALNTISLRGKLEHRHLSLGNTLVKHALLSFCMLDGRFIVDDFKLELYEGSITASATTENGKGQAQLNIALPEETLLTLARDFSDNQTLALPANLKFEGLIKARVKGNMQVPLFEPGKTHLTDLIPTLSSCEAELTPGGIHYAGATLKAPVLSLNINGIDYAGNDIRAESIHLGASLETSEHQKQSAEASGVNLKLDLKKLRYDKGLSCLSIQQADLAAGAGAAQLGETRLQDLQASGQLTDLDVNFNDIARSLRSAGISADITVASFTHESSTLNDFSLNLAIPEGLHVADAWKNMQKDTHLRAKAGEIIAKGGLRARDTEFSFQHIDANRIALRFRSLVGEEAITLEGTAALQEQERILLDELKLHLPAAKLSPLFGGEPLAELKLPRLMDATGSAIVDATTGRLITCNFEVQVPELVRVCNNVHVHKGMEIPLSLSIRNGNFATKEDGSMYYEADVHAAHQSGDFIVHVSGDPLKECRITGSNTITVDVINALIDNVDAHWIMRDFRCTRGKTRNLIKDIDTIIRYDKGVYVLAKCNAELYNMDFLLGALRDVEAADGTPTGEEYLRTDLGKDPYSRIKEGKCGVEVEVQLDCVNEQGKAKPDIITINLTNPDLLYDNKPWLKRMGYKKGATTSRITGEAVRFDIEACTISLHKLKGTCYPAYSIGMFYAPIQHFLADVELRDPARIQTDYCIFPLSRRCKVPMQGLIYTETDNNAGYKFLGTTIPLTNFSGFINISDVDVYLDQMNAQCWGGSMSGALRIGFAGEHTTLDGYFTARNMNLKDIVASYGEEFTPATCNGYIRFQAPEPTLEAVQAYGQVHLQDGDLMQIGLFRPIGALLSDMPGNLTKLQKSVMLKSEEAPPNWVDDLIHTVFNTGSNAIDTMQDSAYKVPFANHFLRYGIDEAYAHFDITNGHLISRQMKAKGYNLDVKVEMDIDLDKLTLTGDLWPTISSVPTILISPITFLSDFLIDVNLYGDLVSPQWEFGLSKKLKREENSLTPAPQKATETKKK